MSSKIQHNKEEFTSYENTMTVTVPELMILGLLGVCVLIALLLCLDTHKCSARPKPGTPPTLQGCNFFKEFY